METKNIKYTTDGKKVIVVGKLNAQETIVQEIFISNDVEVPSGENFVVKSLHDAPVISWKEAETKKWDTYYNTKKCQYDSDLDRLEKAYRSQSTELHEKIKFNAGVIKKLSPETFRILKMFLEDKVKWIVKLGRETKIIEWRIENAPTTSSYDSGIRLLSLWGRDDGTLMYKQSEYSDGSGNDRNIVHPFENYEDALAFFKSEILKQGVNDSTIKTAKQYHIEFPKEQLIEYYQKRKLTQINNITSTQKELEKWNSLLNEYNEALANLGVQ